MMQFYLLSSLFNHNIFISLQQIFQILQQKSMNNFQEMSQFYFFPEQFRKNLNQINLNSENIASSVFAMAKIANSWNQAENTQIQFQKQLPLRIDIINQFILIRKKENAQIIEAVQTNFSIKFQVIKQKSIEKKNQLQISSGLASTNQPELLVFTFKGFDNQITKFYLLDDSNFSTHRFIQSLQKIIVQNNDFHKRFKPNRKVYAAQNFSLIKSKDLQLKRDAVVKAFPKDGSQTQLWKECISTRDFHLLKDKNILQLRSFFQSQNSIYIIFQNFDYFIQNFSRRLNQKYRSSFSTLQEKKIIVVLQIISKVIKTTKTLHQNGYSMNGSFTDSNLVFTQVNGQTEPKLNPLSNNVCRNNEMVHQQKLKQKVLQFQNKNIFQTIAPQHFLINEWKYLNDSDYFNYLKKSDVFGVGNLLHLLLFNHSVFGQFDKDPVKKNNKNGRYSLSQQLSGLKIVCPEIVDLLEAMIQKDLDQRIQMNVLEEKINGLLLIMRQKPRTSTQLRDQEQLQMKQQKLHKHKKQDKIQNQRLFMQAENNIQIKNNNQQKKPHEQQQQLGKPYKKRKQSQS